MMSRQSKCWLAAWFAFGLLLFAPGGSAAESSAVDEQFRLLASGTLQEQTEAARWLGLNGVHGAWEPLYKKAQQLRKLQATSRDKERLRLLRTTELMLALVRQPRLLQLESVSEVLRDLEDPVVHVRARAVRHLAYFAPEGAVALAAPFLEAADDLEREEAITTLYHLGDQAHANRALELLDDPGGAIRLQALKYLLGLHRPRLLPRLIPLAADANRWIAEPALRALLNGVGERAVAAGIFDLLRSEPDPTRLARYLEALGRFQKRDAWPKRWRAALTEILSHADSTVQLQAAVLLGDNSEASGADGSVASILIALLDSERTAERLAAAQALVSAEISVDAARVDVLLSDASPAVQLAGLDLLQGFSDADHRNALLRIISHPGGGAQNSDVLSRALSRLADVGLATDVPWLIDRIPMLSFEGARINAALSLATLEHRWQTGHVREWFHQRLADPTTERSLRNAIVNSLQVVGGPEFLETLADELRGLSADDDVYARTLIGTMSILVGRQVHGAAFGAPEAP